MPSELALYRAKKAQGAKRSKDMSEGMDKAIGKATGAVDTFGKLSMALSEDAEGDEARAFERERGEEMKAHGREIEAKNNARGDERYEAEKEDRARRIAKEDREAGGNMDPERGDVMASLNAATRAMDDKPVADPLAPVAKSSKDRLADLNAEIAAERLITAKNKNKPKAPKVVDPNDPKRIKADADARAAVVRANNLENPAAKGPDASERKEIRGIDELAGDVDALIEQVGKTGTGMDVAGKAFLGRAPLIGDKIDPGAQNRTTEMMLGSMKAAAIKEISGATVSEPERKALSKFLANVGSTTSTSMAALKILKQDLARARAQRSQAGVVAAPAAGPAADDPFGDIP